MYLPVSSAKNAEFLDYTKHILVDNYKNNNYISDYIDRPVVGPIQKYFHTAMADDFHDTGPRSLHEFIYKDRHVTLTFYIQYGNQKNLMTLLDLLDHYDIRKAVFFFENRYINEHEFVIKRIQESGYVVKEWNNLNSYNESPYEPSIYKGIPLIQGKILKNVHTDRVAANFLDARIA